MTHSITKKQKINIHFWPLIFSQYCSISFQLLILASWSSLLQLQFWHLSNLPSPSSTLPRLLSPKLSLIPPLSIQRFLLMFLLSSNSLSAFFMPLLAWALLDLWDSRICFIYVIFFSRLENSSSASKTS